MTGKNLIWVLVLMMALPVSCLAQDSGQDVSPSAQTKEEASSPQDLSGTAQAPEVVPGESSEVPLPESVTPTASVEAKPKPKVYRYRFPLPEMTLSAIGVGLLGAATGFIITPQASNGNVDYVKADPAAAQWGLIGVAGGAALGYLLANKREEVLPDQQGFLILPERGNFKVVLNQRF
jgi:hypothetical protein